MTASRARLAVVGAGWAGLSAAVTAQRRGCEVTLYEMAAQAGGRARSHADSGLDNGQHILIGAYRDTLTLMRQVGVDPEQLLLRQPLALVRAGGPGLALEPGPAAWAFPQAVLRCRAWSAGDKLRLLAACVHWTANGFRCQPDRSVAELCRSLPATVKTLLIEPLCVSALNTPADQASAAVFLRVLQDGLFSGPGSCDLLLPRRPLHHLLPGPAIRWLQQRGVGIRIGRRVMDLQRQASGWALDGQQFDGVVLACGVHEARRLVQSLAPAWIQATEGLRFEPIVTVRIHCPGGRLPLPMMALRDDEQAPAQFVFDHGTISGQPDHFAFVVSGAAHWVDRGLDATAGAVLTQARQALPATVWPAERARIESAVAERRATFRCTPGLQRPPGAVSAGLAVAGDYVDGPYPATLEGAVRSGKAAIDTLLSGRS
jgi:squalene-associated FAD-dependent desaturase